MTTRPVCGMFSLIKRLIGSTPGVRRRVIRLAYEVISGLAQERGLGFMNYGYASLSGDGETVALEAADERDRFPIQLYQHVVAPVDLRGKQVLEVGSGRGGGAAYLMRYHGPRSVTGVDVAASAVDYCNRTHRLAGLSFLQGDAEHLPCPAASVDVVVNVESSHGYGSMAAFLAEVHRVLRPGGQLCFADVRDSHHMEALIQDLRRGPLRVVAEEEITANVFSALERTHAQREQQLASFPFWIRKTLRDMSGVRGGAVHRAFVEQRRRYTRCLLVKAAPTRPGTAS